jgi:hypothetical protein
LLRVIRADIQKHLERADIKEGRVIDEIRCGLSKISLEDTKREVCAITASLSELETLSAKLYEDRLTGTINLDTYKQLSVKNEEEIVEKKADRDTLIKALSEAEKNQLDSSNWIKQIRAYLTLEQPDRETLSALIERIEVGENKGTRTQKRQSIRIFYRFVGYLD